MHASTNAMLAGQNDPENIRLLRASIVAYRLAKRGEIRITNFLLVLGVAYPICFLYWKDEDVRTMLFGCSFLLTILIELLTGSFRGNTGRGALFKEEFDTNVFGLPWKSTLRKLDRREVLHFSQLYKGEDIKNWYSPGLSAKLDRNVAIAVLQHSNTSWDIELRKAYRRWLVTFVAIYSIVLCATFVVLKVDARMIFFLLFSLLALFTHFIALIRGHSEAIERREVISTRLDEVIRGKKKIGVTELRDIQDDIYATRCESAKVPDFVFRWYHERLGSEIDEYIREVNSKCELPDKRVDE